MAELVPDIKCDVLLDKTIFAVGYTYVTNLELGQSFFH